VATLSPKQKESLIQDLPAVVDSLAYQQLYTNIELSWSAEERQNDHTLLLTTPRAIAESATVAVNLALTAVQNGMTTLLVDADLHAPSLHTAFGTNAPGLSDLNNKDEAFTAQSIQPYLNKVATSKLFLLSAGQKQLSSGEIGHLFTMRLGELLHGLRQCMREIAPGASLIIFYCPAILAETEASLISAQVERTFLLLAAGRTTRTEARKAQAQLQRAQAHLEGIIWLEKGLKK
jgi:succinoglycan biosynthesis transport protein ExoP